MVTRRAVLGALVVVGALGGCSPHGTSSSGSSGPLYSTEQVAAALSADHVATQTNPLAPGGDTPNDCGALTPAEKKGVVRETFRTQLVVDANPDDDADLVVFAMVDSFDTAQEANSRKDDTRRNDWPSFEHGNLYVEIQLPAKDLPAGLDTKVQSAVDSIASAASPVPPVLRCN